MMNSVQVKAGNAIGLTPIPPAGEGGDINPDSLYEELLEGSLECPVPNLLSPASDYGPISGCIDWIATYNPETLQDWASCQINCMDPDPNLKGFLCFTEFGCSGSSRFFPGSICLVAMADGETFTVNTTFLEYCPGYALIK